MQIAGVIGIAGEGGDVDSLITPADRLERLNTGRGQQYYSTGTFYFNGPWNAIEQGMAILAEAKAFSDVQKLLDYGLAAARRKLATQSPAALRQRHPILQPQLRPELPGLGRQDPAPHANRLSAAERVHG